MCARPAAASSRLFRLPGRRVAIPDRTKIDPVPDCARRFAAAREATNYFSALLNRDPNNAFGSVMRMANRHASQNIAK